MKNLYKCHENRLYDDDFAVGDFQANLSDLESQFLACSIHSCASIIMSLNDAFQKHFNILCRVTMLRVEYYYDTQIYIL